MTSFTRRAPIAATLAAAALVVAVGAASATRTVDVPSKVTIESHGLRFSGEVKTAAVYEPCEQQRKVTLFKVISGGPDQAVGHDTTDNHGRWSVTPQGSAGITLARFYAKVKKLSQGTAGTIYVCLAGKSRTTKVHQ